MKKKEEIINSYIKAILSLDKNSNEYKALIEDLKRFKAN